MQALEGDLEFVVIHHEAFAHHVGTHNGHVYLSRNFDHLVSYSFETDDSASNHGDQGLVTENGDGSP